MKRSLLSARSFFSLLTMGLALGLGSAHAELREFKNTQGVVIKAQLKKAKGPMIFLTNEAGKEVQVALTAFSKEDQNYILKWIAEDPLAIDYNFVCKAEEKQLPGKTANNAYYERVASMQKNYNVSVQNSSRNPLDDLTIDWCAFMLNKVTISASSGSYYFSTSDSSPMGELRVRRGSEVIPKLPASHTYNFTSSTFTIDSVIDKYYTGQKRKDTMQGVWLRFYRGDTMVGEWKSPDCPKTEWPGGAHKSKPKQDDLAKNEPNTSVNKTSTNKTSTSTKDGAVVTSKEEDVGDIVKIFQLDDKK